LLALAQVPVPAASYQGKPVEPITGKNLLPMVLGQTTSVYGPNEAIGYELSGNQSVFKGDLKLIKNLPPVGDGQWHLYDIVKDPGETQDLKDQLPAQFKAMQDDYAAYAQANGVLPMPPGYHPQDQVLTNALINVYLPQAKRWALTTLAVLVASLTGFMVWRRQKKMQRLTGAGTP
jgi:hypothetical protein